MLSSYWSQFKSGTDIRGIASDGVLGEKINLTDEVINNITTAFAKWLSKKIGKSSKDIRISVGNDSRISAARIKNRIIGSLNAIGVDVIDCGLSSTPAMFFTTIDINSDAAIQITASHHPFNRNGMKFFTKEGGLQSDDIDQILKDCEGMKSLNTDEKFLCREFNFMEVYSAKLRKIICDRLKVDEHQKPLKGFKIVVDAGNGAGGFYAKDVLEKLGADISGSQFLDPNGMFPNHIPNPEDKNAIDSLVKATITSNADLGIIFDTDVDRAAVADRNGKPLNRNALVALAASIALEGNGGGTIVTDSITSHGLKEYIENELKAVHHRYKRGYKNVINEAIRLNNLGVNAPLAIETSGHAAFRDNYFLDDGAYLVTKIIIKMVQLKKSGKSLTDILENLNEPLETTEIRIKVESEDFKVVAKKIIEDLKIYAQNQSDWLVETPNYEGIRVSFDEREGDGWFLLRLSVHDPIMPLNVESNSKGGVEIILRKVYEFLKGQNGIDLSKIKEYINEGIFV